MTKFFLLTSPRGHYLTKPNRPVFALTDDPFEAITFDDAAKASQVQALLAAYGDRFSVVEVDGQNLQVSA